MFSRKITTTFAATMLAAAVAVLAAGPSEGSSSLPISSCGQAVSTNVVLTKDLDCASTGMFVTVSYGITIDLNGHVLKGDGVSGHMGIADFGGYDKLTIKNGVIRNFDDGIHAVNAADNLTVSNVVTSGNAADGIHVEGTSASIMSSTASGNAFTGIKVVGEAASIKSSSAVGNGSRGIWVNGDGATVKSSRAIANWDGIELDSNAASVSSSTVAGNGETGLYVGGNAASVKSNTVVGNTFVGIRTVGDAPTIIGNKADENGFTGGKADGGGAGIEATSYTTPPSGKNTARANDYLANCVPASLC